MNLHYPNVCPKCKSRTTIVFGNGIGKDEIQCQCGWTMRLMTSTALSNADLVRIMLEAMQDKALRNENANQ